MSYSTTVDLVIRRTPPQSVSDKAQLIIPRYSHDKSLASFLPATDNAIKLIEFPQFLLLSKVTLHAAVIVDQVHGQSDTCATVVVYSIM